MTSPVWESPRAPVRIATCKIINVLSLAVSSLPFACLVFFLCFKERRAVWIKEIGVVLEQGGPGQRKYLQPAYFRQEFGG